MVNNNTINNKDSLLASIFKGINNNSPRAYLIILNNCKIKISNRHKWELQEFNYVAMGEIAIKFINVNISISNLNRKM